MQPRANIVLRDEIGQRAWGELLAENRERWRNPARFASLLRLRLTGWRRWPLGERLVPYSSGVRRLVYDLSQHQDRFGVTGDSFEPFIYRR